MTSKPVLSIFLTVFLKLAFTIFLLWSLPHFANFYHAGDLTETMWYCYAGLFGVCVVMWAESFRPTKTKLPLWLKLFYTLFLAWFISHFISHYKDYDFMEIIWFCYVGLFVVGVGMWIESPLLFSWQAVSLVFVQLVFTVDAVFHLVPGLERFSFGWTSYMFDPNEHLEHRLLAWFHTPMPFVLLYGVWRLGYDRRAFLVQTVSCWLLMLLAFFYTKPIRNVNYVYGPFKEPLKDEYQVYYLIGVMLGIPLLIYLPTHLILAWLMPHPP